MPTLHTSFAKARERLSARAYTAVVVDDDPWSFAGMTAENADVPTLTVAQAADLLGAVRAIKRAKEDLQSTLDRLMKE